MGVPTVRTGAVKSLGRTLQAVPRLTDQNVIMMVVNALTPNRHRAISNHYTNYYDFSATHYIVQHISHYKLGVTIIEQTNLLINIRERW